MTRRISLEQYRKMCEPKKPSKYRAKKVEADGFVFDSRAEFKRYLELKELQRFGKIHSLIVHPGVSLGVCYWKLDFSYIRALESLPTFEDVKGVRGRDLGIKLKLMREKYAIDVRILDRETDSRLFR